MECLTPRFVRVRGSITVLLRSDGCAVACGNKTAFTRLSAGLGHTVQEVIARLWLAEAAINEGETVDLAYCKDDELCLICSNLAGEGMFDLKANWSDLAWETRMLLRN